MDLKQGSAYFSTDRNTVFGCLRNNAMRFNTFVTHQVDIFYHWTKCS